MIDTIWHHIHLYIYSYNSFFAHWYHKLYYIKTITDLINRTKSSLFYPPPHHYIVPFNTGFKTKLIKLLNHIQHSTWMYNINDINLINHNIEWNHPYNISFPLNLTYTLLFLAIFIKDSFFTAWSWYNAHHLNTHTHTHTHPLLLLTFAYQRNVDILRGKQ